MANSKMFVYYSKTKAEFIAANLPNTYTNHIVFIKGDANGNGSCIYTHGMYFANFAELLSAINYVKGVKVGTDTYNAAAGGGYVAFEAVDPSTLTLDVSNGKLQFGLTTAFVNKVNNTATNLGTNTDAANADGSAFARIANLADLVSKLTGEESVDGSIKDQIKDAIDALRTELSGDWSGFEEQDPMSIAEVYGAFNTSMNALNQEIAGIKEDIGTVDNLETENKEVVKAINEVLAAVGTGGTAAVVTVTEKGATGDYAQVYEIKQGTTTVGTINIPKELVVESGEVVTNPTGKPAGTYIKLTLQNVADPLYIDVAKLVDVYTAQQSATQVQLNIDASNVISATIVAGSITATELASNAVTTTKIADKNVTKDKLADTVQTSLGKADTAYQKPSTGIPKTDLASAVQASLGKADDAAPQSTTYTKTEVDNKVKTVDDKLAGYYTKAEVDAMWEWEVL